MAYSFRKIRLSDAIKFSKWGKHDDIRFYQYNFPFEEKYEYEQWFFFKQRLISKKIYGLYDTADNPVGFITLKNIKWLKRRAELGVAINPDRLGEGLGRKLIEAYLAYVFKTYPINTMRLRVATFNVRAQKCYEACGFTTITQRREPFEEQSFKMEIMAEFPDQFYLKHNILYTDFFVMEIDKESFLNQKKNLS